jgi:hypothetical protein
VAFVELAFPAGAMGSIAATTPLGKFDEPPMASAVHYFTPAGGAEVRTAARLGRRGVAAGGGVSEADESDPAGAREGRDVCGVPAAERRAVSGIDLGWVLYDARVPTSRIALFNGKFFLENAVLILLRDRGWKYGDGAFDMTRTFNGRAFRMKEHVERFYR